MITRPADKQRIEEYARSLLDAAKGEYEGPLDVQRLNEVLKFSPDVSLMLERMRHERDVDRLEQVFDDLKALLASEADAVRVDVTTAVRMNASLRKKVHDKCAADFDKPVYLVEHVDPKIFGGIILEAQGHRHDASVRAQLLNVRKTLSASITEGGM